MVTADATDLPLDKIFLLYQCPTYYFLVSQSMVVIGQTIPSVRPTRRTRNLGPKHTAMIGGIILNNAHTLSAGNFIYARIIMHKPHYYIPDVPMIRLPPAVVTRRSPASEIRRAPRDYTHWICNTPACYDFAWDNHSLVPRPHLRLSRERVW